MKYQKLKKKIIIMAHLIQYFSNIKKKKMKKLIMKKKKKQQYLKNPEKRNIRKISNNIKILLILVNLLIVNHN